MKHKILILLLACLLLAGCGTPKASAPDTNTPAPTAEETAEPTPTVDQTPEPPTAAPDESAAALMGTWVDDDHPEIALVFDDKCAGAVSITDADGTVTVWTFSGVHDPDTGGITYTDCVKQIHTPDGATTTEYTDGSGSFTSLDGFLYWHDEQADAGAGCRFHMAL